MSFTTGGQLLSHIRRQSKDTESAFLHDRIDDLESALLCHTSLIHDITASKPHPQDSEGQLLFPMTCYKRMLEQQGRLKTLVGKLANLTKVARDKEAEYEQIVEDVKVQEVRDIREMAAKVRETKAIVEEREHVVQELEREHTDLDAEKEFISRAHVSDVSRHLSVTKVKQLIKEVSREAYQNEREKELLKGKCFVCFR